MFDVPAGVPAPLDRNVDVSAIDSALENAFSNAAVPQLYLATLGDPQPETTIDVAALQAALNPDPITVTEITVKAGDTLTSIAEENGVPVQDVIEANPQIKNPDMIRPGDVVSMAAAQAETGLGRAPIMSAQQEMGQARASIIMKGIDKLFGMFPPKTKEEKAAKSELEYFLDAQPDSDMSGFFKYIPDSVQVATYLKDRAERKGTPVLDMAKLSLQDAQEQAAIRSASGITESLRQAPEGLVDPALQDTVPETPAEEPAQAGGLMTKPITSEQRTAMSDMSDLTKAQGHKITSNGSFSLSKLKSAVNKSIDNVKKKAMLAGIVDVEVGTAGPRTEGRYTAGNINNLSSATFAVGDRFEGRTLTANDPAIGTYKHQWRRRLIRDGVMAPDGTLTNYSGANVFNSVYANRNGNGDYASGDGDKFRGMGLVQITGRSNYQEVQNRLNAQGMDVDLINNPELVNDERYALAASIAYLDYAGMTDTAAEGMSARGLQAVINPRAPVATAEERWESAITALRAEDPTAADEMEKRNEYVAQRTVGATVDGLIGPRSVRSMRRWLQEEGVTIPEGATNMDIVVLVNENA
jgi:LysM repeat protein